MVTGRWKLFLVAGAALALLGAASAALSEAVKPLPASVTLRLGLAGDVNLDLKVGPADLALIGQNFHTPHPAADVNGDGIVDIFDLAIAGIEYGKEASP